MSTQFHVPTLENAPAASKPIFEGIQKKLGRVPNLYASIGYSGEVLQSYLGFSSASESAFTGREAQAVYLLVSEYNDCAYCLAAHTALAKMNKFSEEETYDLRRGESSEAKIQALLNLTKAIIENKGRANEATINAFFEAGYDHAQFSALNGLIAAKTYSNYFHNTTDIPVDFPAAKPLSEVEAVLA